MTSKQGRQPQTTLSVRYVVNLLEAAKARGLDPARLCAQTGISPPATQHPDLRYFTREYLALWGAIMDRLGDPAFPIDVARLSAPETSDILGFAFLTSANLGEGLERISRHLLIMTDGARWQLEANGAEARLALLRPGALRPEHAFADEFALSHIVYWSRRVMNVDWKPLEVRFRHPAPRPAARAPFEALFRAPLVHGSERSELVFSESLLHLPLPKANSAIATFFDQQIEAQIARRFPGQQFVSSLRSAIIDGLSRQTCSMEKIARHLGISTRTLGRRLDEEGVNFQRLLDETRCELAQQYLRERRLSVSEIAFVLGYAQPSAFHHAFRRWTGETPAAYRARALPSVPQRRVSASADA